jgi:hypothetical protein
VFQCNTRSLGLPGPGGGDATFADVLTSTPSKVAVASTRRRDCQRRGDTFDGGHLREDLAVAGEVRQTK